MPINKSTDCSRLPRRAPLGVPLLGMLFLAPALFSTVAIACDRVSPTAHVIVARQALSILPEPLRGLMKPRVNQVVEDARALSELASAFPTMKVGTHFLWLDVAATDLSSEERRRAALSFPREAVKAQTLCAQRRVR